MKKVYLLLALCLLNFSGFATTYYSQGNTDFTVPGNWNSATDGSGSTPVDFSLAGDVWVVQSIMTNSITATPTWTVAGTLSFTTGTLIFDNSGSFNTTINLGGNLDMSSGSGVIENSDSRSSALGNLNLNITGDLLVNAASIIGYNGGEGFIYLNFANTSSSFASPQHLSWASVNVGCTFVQVDINSGCFVALASNTEMPFDAAMGEEINGALILGAYTLDCSTNNFDLNSGATLYTAYSGGVDAVTDFVFFNDGGGTYIFNGAVAQTTGSSSIPASIPGSNIIINNTGGGVTLSQSEAIKSLTLTAGTLSVGSDNLSLKGNWINNEGTAAFVPGAGTVTMNGSATFQEIEGSFSSTFNTLTIDNTSGSPLGVTVLTAFTLGSGNTLNLEDGILNTGGNLTMNSGSNINVDNGTLDATPTGYSGVNLTYTDLGFNASAYTTSNNEWPTSFTGNVTVNKTTSHGTITMNSGKTVTGNLTIGTVASTAAGTLAVASNSIYLSGNWTNNSGATAYTHAGGEVDMDGTAAQSILGSYGTSFNDLIIDNATGVSLTPTTTFASGSELDLENGAFNNTAGNLIMSCGSTLYRDNGSLAATPTSYCTSLEYSNLGFNQATLTTGNEWPSNFTGNVTVAHAGATITLGGTVSAANITLSVGTLSAGANNISLTGNWSNNDATGAFTAGSGTVTFNGASAQSLGGGSATTFNNLTINDPGNTVSLGLSGTTVGGTLLLTAGTLDVTASNYSLTVNGNWTNNASFNGRAGTVTLSGAANQTIGGSSATTFGGLTINDGANTVSLGVNGTTTGGTLTISTGTLDVSASNYSFIANGDWTNNSGAAAFNARSGTVTFSGAGAQNINGTFGNTFNILAINNTAGVTLSTANTIPSSGTLDLQQGTLTTGGNLVTNAGAIVNVDQGTLSAAPASYIVNLIYKSLGTGGNYTTGNEFPATFAGNLAINKNGNTITLNGAKTLNGVAGSYGNVTLSAGTLASGNFNLALTSNWSNNSATTAFTAGTGTVTFNNTTGNQNILGTDATSFNTLTIDNTSGVTLSCTGTTTFNSGNTVNLDAGTFTLLSPLSMASGSNVNVDNGAFSSTPGTYSGINLTYEDIDVNAAAHTTGNEWPATFTGNVTVNKTTSHGIITLNGTKTLTGNIVIGVTATTAAGALDASASNYNILLTGNWTNNSTTATSFNARTGTVTFDGSTAQAIGGSTSTGFYNLWINNTAGVTLSTATTIPAAGSLNLQQGTLTTGGNLATTTGASVNVDEGALSAAPASYIVNLTYKSLGTGGNLTTGNEFPSPFTGNLIVNKAGNTITLNAAKTLSGVPGAYGNITIGNGTLASGNFNMALTGNWTNNSAFTAGTGTVTFNSTTAAQSILGSAATGFNTLTIDNTFSGVTLNCTGTTTFNSGNTLNLETGAFTLTSALSMASGSNVNVDEGTFSSTPGTYSGINLTYTNLGVGGTYTTGNEFPAAFNGNVTVNKLTNTIVLNGSKTISGGAGFGNLTITAGTLDASVSNYNISLTGNWANNATATSFLPRTGTVTLDGATAQAIGGSAATSFYNLWINNTAGVTLNTATTIPAAGSLNLQQGAFSDGANLSMTTGSSVNVDEGSLTTVPASYTVNLTYKNLGTGGNVTTSNEFPATFTGNLIINKAGNTITLNGNKALTGGAPTYGNVTLSAGTLDASASNYNISLTGNWLNNALATAFTPRTGTVTFNGTSAQAIGGAFSTSFYDLTIFNSTGVTLNTTTTIPAAGALNLVQGAFNDVATLNLTTGSSVNVDKGSLTTVPGSYTVNLTYENLGVGGNVTTSNEFPATFTGNLIINKAGNTITLNAAKNLTGAAPAYGNITLTAGTLASANNNIALTGNWANNATATAFTPGTGTVTFDGTTAQAIGGGASTSFYNLWINNTAGVTLNTATTIPATGSLSLEQGAFNNVAALTLTTGATVNVDDGSLTNIPASYTVNLTYENLGVGGNVTTSNEFPPTFSGNLIINKPGNTITLNGNKVLNGVAPTYGNVTLLAGTLDANAAGNYNISLTSNWTNSDAITAFIPELGTVIFDGTTGGQIIGGNQATTFNDVTIDNGSGVDLDVATLAATVISSTGAVNLETGTFTLTSPLDMSIASSVNVDNGTFNVAPAIYTDINLTYENLGFNQLAFTTGNELPASFSGNVTVNHNGATITLGQTVAVGGDPGYGNITLTSGTLSANNYNISLTGNWTNNASATAFTAGTGTVTMNGTLGQNLNGTFGTGFYIFTLNDNGGVNVNVPTTFATGTTLNVVVGTITTTAANLSMMPGSFVNNDAGSITTTPGVYNGVTLTYENLGFDALAQTTGNFFPATFNGNVVLNKPGLNLTLNTSKNLTNSPQAGYGNITFIGGTLIAGGYDMSLNGNWTNNEGPTAFTAGANTVTFNSPTTGQTIGGTGVTDFNGLTINNTSGTAVSLGLNGTTVGGNMTFTAGTLDVTASNFSLYADGNWINNESLTAFNGRAGTVYFNGTGAQGLGGTSATTFATLNIDNTGPATVTLGIGGTVINTSLILSSGFLDAGAGNNYSILDNGDWTNNTSAGAFIPELGTVFFQGTVVQNIGGSSSTNFYNLWDNNTTSSLDVNTNINVAGTMDLNGANTVILPLPAVVINSPAIQGTLTGNGYADVTRIIATPDFASQYRFATYNLSNMVVDYNGLGNQTISGSSCGGAVGAYGTLETGSFGTKTLGCAIVVNNALIIGSSTTLDVSTNNYQITDAGSWTDDGSFNAENGLVLFDGTPTNVITGSIAGSNEFWDLQFNHAGSSWSFLSEYLAVGHNFTITAGTINAPGPGYTLTIGGSYSNSGTFNNNGGTVIMDGFTGGLTLSGTMTGTSSFNILTFNGVGGGWSFGANPANVASNFTITNGTVTAPSTTLTIGGNYNNAGIFMNNSGTVTMDATSLGHTMSGNMTNATISSFYNLTFNGVGGSWTFGSNAADVANNFTITAGTVTAPTSLLQVGANWNNAGTFTNNSGTVNMNSTTGGLTLNGTMTGTSAFNNLTFNGVGGGWTFGANSATTNGNFVITNGTVTAPSTTLNVGGNFTNLGSFTNNNGTVNMDGAGTYAITGNMVLANQFWNLVFNNSAGAWTFGSSSATVGNNFTITSGDVTAPSSTLLVAGNWANNGGSYDNNGGLVTFDGTTGVTQTIGGTGTSAISGANKFYNLTFAGTGTTQYTFGVNADVANNLVLSAGTVNASNLTYNIGNNFTTSLGSIFSNSGASTINIGGNYANGGTFTASTGRVNMVGPFGALTLLGNMTGASAFNNLNFNGGANWSFAANSVTVNDSFNIMSGTVTAPSSAAATGLTIGDGPGFYTNNGSFVNSGGTVYFNATTATAGTINGSMTGSNKFNNVVFEGITGSSYTFTSAADIGGAYTQTSGTVVAPSSNLNVAGNFVESAGIFNPNSGTVTMNGTTAGVAVTAATMNTLGTSDFYNLVFNGDPSVSTWNLTSGDPFTVANNFTITNGTVNAPAATTITVDGNWLNNSNFSASTSTIAMNGSGSGLTLSGFMTGANKFNNLTFSGAGAWSFGGSSADVGGNFTLSSGTVTAPSSLLQVAGNWVYNGGTYANNNGTVNMNGTGASTIGGALGMTGSNDFYNLSFTNGVGSTTFNFPTDIGNNFTINTGTVVAPTTGSKNLNVGGNWNNIGGTFTAGTGTVTMDGTTTGLYVEGNITGTSQLWNITFSGVGGGWTFGTSPVTIGNNLTLTNGTLTAPAGNLNVAGNWVYNAGSFNNNGGTVNMNGTGASFINGTGGGMNGANKFYNLTFTNGAGSTTISNNTDVANNLLVTSGTVNAGANTYNIGNNFTTSLGSTFSNSGASTINIGGNYANGGTFTASTGTVNMDGASGALTLSGTMTGASSFYNLKFNGGANWNFGANAVQANNNFNIISGTVTAPNTTLTLAGNSATSTFTNSGSFNNNGGTVIVTNTTPGVWTFTGAFTGVNSFYNFKVNNTGTTEFTNAADISAGFSQSNGLFVAPPDLNLNVAGTFTQTGGTFNPNNGTVTMNGTSTGILITTANMNLPATPSCFYNLTFNGIGGGWSFATPTSFTVSNNFTITTGTVTPPVSAAINVGGSWANAGSFVAASGTVNMYGTVPGLTLSGNLTGSTDRFWNLTFSGTGAWAFASPAEVGGSLLISGTGAVTAPSTTLQVDGNWTNTGGSANFINNSGTVNMAGSGTMSSSGAGTMTGSNKFNNLTFNNIGGSWTISNALDAGGNFTITNGTVSALSAGTINVFGNWSSASGCTFTAPVTLNDGGNWTNLGTFNNNSANAGTVNMNGSGSYAISGNLTGSPTNRFWNLTFNNGGGNWTFGGSSADVGNNFTITAGDVTAPSTNLNVGGNWVNNGGTFSNNSGTVTMYAGPSTLSVSGTGSMTGGNAFYNLSFTGSSTYTFNARAAANNNFTNTSGTVLENGNSLIVGNNFTNNGTFTNNAVVDTLYVGGNFNNTSTFTAGNNGTVDMTGSAGSYTIGTSMTGANAFNNLIFTGGAGWSFTSNAANVNNNFYIASGAVTAPSTTLTIGDAAGTYSNYGTFNNNGGTVVMASSTVSSGSLNGNMVSGNKFNNLSFIGSANATYTFNGPADVAGNFLEQEENVVAPSGNLNIAGNFTLNTTAPQGNFNPNNGTVTMNGTSGTFTISTNGNMNALGTSDFYNLVFNGTGGSWNFTSNPFTVNNNFTITNGTVVAPNQIITVDGSWTNNGVFNSTTNPGGTVAFDGSASTLTLNGNMTASTSSKFWNLTFGLTNSGTWTFTAPADVAGVFTQNLGTVVAPSTNLNVAGGTTSGVVAYNHTGGNFNPNGGTVTMNGSTAGTFSITYLGTPVAGTNCFNNLTFTPTAAETFSINNNLLMTGNVTNSNTSGTVTLASTGLTLTVGGNWTNNGTFLANQSTVLMNGTTGGLELNGNLNSTAPVGSFYNLTFNGVSGGWTCNNPTVTVTNNLTITNGEVIAPITNLFIGGNYSNAGTFNAPLNSNVDFNGSGVAQSISGTLTGTSSFYNIQFGGTAASSYVFNPTGGIATVENTWNNSSAGTVLASTFTYFIGGSYANSGVFNSGTSTVNMMGPIGAYTLTGNMTGTSAFYVLDFTGGASWSFGGNVQTNSNFIISSGTVTAPSGGTITIGDGLTGTVANYSNFGTFIHNNSTVVMQSENGSGLMVGNMTGTNARFYNLTFAAPSGTYSFGTYAAEVYNTFSQTGAACNVTAPSTTLTVWGSFLKSGVGNFTPNNGTVIMNGVVAGLSMNTTNMNTLTTSSFYNLTFNGTTDVTTWAWTTPNPFLVTGDFVINGGQVTFPANQTVTCSRSWTNNGTFVHNNSTVIMNGTSTLPPMYMNGNMTQANNGAFFDLTFSGSGTWAFSSNADLGSTFTQTAGTVVAPAVLQVGGNFLHTAGSFNPNIPANGTVIFNAGLTGSAGVNAPAATYSVQTTSMATTTVPPPITGLTAFNNITFDGGAGRNWAFLNTAFTVYGNVSILTGTVTPGYTPGAAPTITVLGSWLNNAVFNANNGTISFNGYTPGLTLTGNMTAATNSKFYAVNFQGTGTGGQYTFNNAADIANNLVIGNGGALNPTVIAPASLLQIYGNFTYNILSTFVHNYGTVSMAGVGTVQIIGGGGSPIFNNLMINNATGVTLGNTNNVATTVLGTLTLQSGRLTVGATITTNNNLILGPTATPVSPGLSGSFSYGNMLVEHTGTASTSAVQKIFIGPSTYLFPVGDSVTNSYTPITMNVTGGTFGAGSYVGVNVYPRKDPHNANVSNFLNRYWRVTIDSISGPAYAAIATYVPGDVGGAENKLSMGDYTGALPWLKYGPTNTLTHTLTSGTVNSAYSEFTGIDSTRPTVTSSASRVICMGQSTQIYYSLGGGDPTLTYSWAPAAYLNATVGDTVIATPPVTTVFTVTVTDGNGFTNQAYTTVTVNPLPGPITGTTTICTGLTSALSSTPFGGTWRSSDAFQASVNTFGTVSALAPGNPYIYYTLPTGCYDSTQLTINQSPAPISGTPSACVGATSLLSDATSGGVWSSSNTALGSVTAGGLVTGIAAGAPNISYTSPVNTCYALVRFTVNALPTVYNVTGGGSYCAGGAGVPVGLSNSESGINYKLYDGGIWEGSQPGTVHAGVVPLPFGIQTAPGTYTIVGANATTGCVNNMTGSAVVTVNPLPNVDTLSAGGSYCAGSGGITITMSPSSSGVNYQLYNDGVMSGSYVAGTGGTITFGTETAPGSYTAVATNTVTGCVNNMYGAAPVVVNSLPMVYNITGGGGYCAGGTGVHVGMSYSDPGVNYELKIGGVPVPSSITLGAASSLDFNLQTIAGVYTAFASNATTGCTVAMAGSETVTVNSLPVAHIVSSSAPAYCAGGSGVSITVNPTDVGIEYQLLNSGIPLGDTILGTSGSISFTHQTLAGSYTVQGINETTGCVNNMTNSPFIVVNPLPAVDTVAGTGSYCSGGTGVGISLANSQSGYSYSLYYDGSTTPVSTITSIGGPLTFPLQTLAGVYKVTGKNPGTSCVNNMYDSAIVTIDPLPAVYTVTGGGSYCFHGNGQHIGLSFSDVGVSYELKLGSVVVSGPVAGSNASIDFGVQYTAGTYSVVATNSVTGCTKVMGAVNIVVNPLPALHIVAASGSSYCTGGTGIDITLDGSNTGGFTYYLQDGSTIEGIMPGTGESLDYGRRIDAGTYIVIAKNNATGCSDTMTGSAPIVLNPLPTAYTVTGGGSYCAGGTGVDISMSSSDNGINYQLKDGGVNIGAPVPGIGAALDFGPQAASGAYTVVAVNTATTCTDIMAGSAEVTINPLPAIDTVLGGGGYCAGAAGAVISLNSSDLEVSYQLYTGGTTAVGLPAAGTGAALSLGAQTIVGDYTVIATNTASLCTSVMYGTVPVSINALPRPYTVLGGGGYCAGGMGVIDSLSGSDLGNTYTLYNGGTAVATLTGNDSVMNFGYQTVPGVYSVIAKNITTGCTSNMIYNDTVTINPLPVAYNLTGGGNYCAGGGGVPVGVYAAVIGTDYQLYNDTTMVGSAAAGAGLPLSFGLQTAPGIYNVIATNTATGCVNHMADSVTVGITPTVIPAVSISVPLGDTVCSGSVTTFTALPINGGSSPTYSWNVNGTYMGVGASMSYIPVNNDNVSVTMASSAACPVPATAAKTIVMTVQDHVMPSVSITANPGTTVCPGTPVTFTATPSYGGDNPQYFWIVNSTLNQTATGTYTYTPSNRDYLILLMISNYSCRTLDSIYSNDFVMYVDTAAPTVSIVAHPGQDITKGQWDTLSAVVTNAGSKPMYQWYVNNTALLGDTTSTLISNQFGNGDSVTCVVTSGGGACGGISVFNSLKISVIGNVGVAQVTSLGGSLRVSPNPNKGDFSIIGTLGTTADETLSLEMSDMLGQTIYTGTVESRKGNVNAKVMLENMVADGMYMLTLRSETGGVTILHIVISQ